VAGVRTLARLGVLFDASDTGLKTGAPGSVDRDVEMDNVAQTDVRDEDDPATRRQLSIQERDGELRE
jgi:hypothetical protein